jgi:hypothetical protein
MKQPESVGQIVNTSGAASLRKFQDAKQMTFDSDKRHIVYRDIAVKMKE